jgi:hypothetical protein
MNLISWLSERSQLSKGEIVIRLIGLVLILGFLIFAAIYTKKLELPLLTALIVLGGFLYGLFQK